MRLTNAAGTWIFNRLLMLGFPSFNCAGCFGGDGEEGPCACAHVGFTAPGRAPKAWRRLVRSLVSKIYARRVAELTQGQQQEDGDGLIPNQGRHDDIKFPIAFARPVPAKECWEINLYSSNSGSYVALPAPQDIGKIQDIVQRLNDGFSYEEATRPN